MDVFVEKRADQDVAVGFHRRKRVSRIVVKWAFAIKEGMSSV